MLINLAKNEKIHQVVYEMIIAPSLNHEKLRLHYGKHYYSLIEMQELGELYVNDDCDLYFIGNPGLKLTKDFLQNFLTGNSLNNFRRYTYDNNIAWFADFHKIERDSRVEIVLEACSQINGLISEFYKLKQYLTDNNI